MVFVESEEISNLDELHDQVDDLLWQKPESFEMKLVPAGEKPLPAFLPVMPKIAAQAKCASASLRACLQESKQALSPLAPQASRTSMPPTEEGMAKLSNEEVEGIAQAAAAEPMDTAEAGAPALPDTPERPAQQADEAAAEQGEQQEQQDAAPPGEQAGEESDESESESEGEGEEEIWKGHEVSAPCCQQQRMCPC